MKVNISQVLYNINGKMFKDEDKKDLTVKELIKNVLVMAPTEEQAKNLDAEYKMRRYNLSIAVATCKKDELDISIEDLGMIKKLSSYLQVDLYGALVFALEGKTNPVIKLSQEEEKKE